jgi:hypothetical protein
VAEKPPQTSQSSLHRFAQTLNPLRHASKVAKAEARATKHLKKLAQDLAKGKTVMKIRRSRLPILVALLALLVCCGGYALYRSIHMPKMHVTHVAQHWMEGASGRRHRAHHGAHHHRHKHSRFAHHRRHKHSRLAHHRRHRHAQTASFPAE